MPCVGFIFFPVQPFPEALQECSSLRVVQSCVRAVWWARRVGAEGLHPSVLTNSLCRVGWCQQLLLGEPIWAVIHGSRLAYGKQLREPEATSRLSQVAALINQQICFY